MTTVSSDGMLQASAARVARAARVAARAKEQPLGTRALRIKFCDRGDIYVYEEEDLLWTPYGYRGPNQSGFAKIFRNFTEAAAFIVSKPHKSVHDTWLHQLAYLRTVFPEYKG